MLYRWLIRPLLFLLPTEVTHHLVFGSLRHACRIPGARALLRWLFASRDPALRTTVFGRTLSSPIGLAAGFDKDAIGFEALACLGFGFVEIGTVTGEPQPGNPKPRLFRLPADRALINRMGFNNRGAASAAPRLAAARTTFVGANVGKTKLVPEAEAVGDYAKSTRLLGPHADYVVVNVSSPNTPGLRDLQSVDKLRPILETVRRTLDESSPVRRVPLLVKIAPDLADADLDAIADLALELGLDGIVATNTTIGREGLRTPADEVARLGAGGLSGAPIRPRALSVLRRLRARTGSRLVLIGVGGIESGADALERIRAGATLVQVYTGMIYEGPGFVARIGRELAVAARAAGYEKVQDAVGTE